MATPQSAVLPDLPKDSNHNKYAPTPRTETPPPPPPPKDDVGQQTPGGSVETYFNPLRLARSNSIYTLSRASFAHQLSQLTSLNLPDTASLCSTLDAIPTAPAATTALSNAASQIQVWIQKAVEVLGGLDAEDDVEWAAAGGRDGLEDVDNAISKFERLVNVYIAAIENLQKRPDICDVPRAELKGVLDTLDEVVTAWANVGELLKEVKRQVELALEWEELWNIVLGEIGLEMENLARLVFEMEEKRHRARFEEAAHDNGLTVDIQELETIVEETPHASRSSKQLNNRFSLPVSFPGSSPLQSPGATASALEDSNLLSLFARMQPLRASLDFLPMRLSSFQARAEPVLPSACEELETRRGSLEKRYKGLEQDAERIRRELGEDRWVTVFRNAGRQAQKMCESVERGITKVEESLDGGSQLATSPALAKKISDYEAKKTNYGPAIQKIIGVIEKGVKDRLTVNGEVLRIRTETVKMWAALQGQMKEVDAALEELHRHTSQQQMRDSMSSIVSNDISMTESTIETPGSSPASSVVLTQANGKLSLPATPEMGAASRRNSMRSSSGSRPPLSRPGANGSTGPSLSKRLSYNPALSRVVSASPSPGSRTSSNTPTPTLRTRGAPVPLDKRPRWNASPRVDFNTFDQQSFSPLSLSSANPHTKSLNGGKIHGRPSIYSYRSARTASSTLPHSSPLGREASSSPVPFSSAHRLGARATSSLAVCQPNRRRTSPSPSPQRRHSQQPQSQGGNGKTSTEPPASPRSRLYTSTATPTSAIRIPSTSSAKHLNLRLPLSSSQGSNRSSLDFIGVEEEDETCDLSEIDSPGTGSPRLQTPKLTLRPATSANTSNGNGTGIGGRRSSLLPVPKARP